MLAQRVRRFATVISPTHSFSTARILRTRAMCAVSEAAGEPRAARPHETYRVLSWSASAMAGGEVDVDAEAISFVGGPRVGS
jgi:hypothetical protein